MKEPIAIKELFVIVTVWAITIVVFSLAYVRHKKKRFYDQHKNKAFRRGNFDNE